MNPLTRGAVLAAVSVLMVAGSAVANIPRPELSDVPDVLTMSPNAAYTVVITINGALGPVVGTLVEVEFSVAASALIVWASPLPPGADSPVTGPGGGQMFTKFTGPMGTARFNMAGGGCVAQKNISEPVAPYVVQVRAGGVVMDECVVNNFDVVDNNGELPEFLLHDICEPYGFIGFPGVSTTGLSDALFHTPQIRQGIPNLCSDYTEPYGDAINLGDASVLTSFIRAGTTCQCIVTF